MARLRMLKEALDQAMPPQAYLAMVRAMNVISHTNLSFQSTLSEVGSLATGVATEFRPEIGKVIVIAKKLSPEG